MSECNYILRAKGQTCPRTCAVCLLGPCRTPNIERVTHNTAEDGGNAFPRRAVGDGGMSLRDWFAGQFIAGHGATHYAPVVGAGLAYQWADAMLKEREACMTTAPFLPMDAPENNHPPISDWRSALCGLQMAAISAEGIKPLTRKSNWERKDVKRPEGGAE